VTGKTNQETLSLNIFDDARRVLCVQPHYDDNDIAAGGTLAALHDRGVEIYYLTVTDDLIGVLDPLLSDEAAAAQLKCEQFAAGEIVGVKNHEWLGQPDAGDYNYFSLRLQVIRAIRQYHPDFVFTCDPWLPYEAHRDHIQTGLAVAEASYLHSMPRLKTDPAVDSQYQPYTLRGVAFYFTRTPNTVVSISTYRGRKRRAVRCYQAQFSPAGMDILLQNLETEERRVANGQPFEYGEAFKVLRPEQLHIDTLAWKG
jgi:N,N'-diacetylchitobiose non-reducing end deacetylase